MEDIKELFEAFSLGVAYAVFAVFAVCGIFCLFAGAIGELKKTAKRHGRMLVALFLVVSAWSAYTAFPSSKEKRKSGFFSSSSPVKHAVLHPQTLLSPEDFARGYALVRIALNEVHDFSAPATARICEKWRLRGANRDRYCIRSSQDLPWRFPFAASSFDKVIVRSSGVVELGDGLARLEPYNGNLGIVPEANWGSIILNAETQSCFWSFLTSSNSLQLTWQNVLHNRLADKPISFQCEFLENGNFIFRYNLSFIGQELTSLYYHRLDPADFPGSDRDGDGLSIDDEIFVHCTDPYCRDTDFDGLSDHEELFRYGTDPRNPHTLSEIYSDGIAVKLGSLDPFSYPLGSTNTVLEHIFYSGTTNGAFAYPQSSDSKAVLKVTISGSGSGDLIVGEDVVPLLPRSTMQRSASSANELLLSVPKNVTLKLKKRGDATVEAALDSSEFAFGVLPSGNKAGWIHFPNTKAVEPCIHDYNAKKKYVSLPVGKDANQVACTWAGGTGVEVENYPPRSAEITGRFNPKEESGVTYSLSHPQYLFGETTYSQTVRFCPKPPEEDEDEEDSPWDSGDVSSDGGNSLCLLCDLGLCGGSCGCECGCDCESNGEDNPEPDEPPGDEICPVHDLAYAECASLHEEEYTNALANAQQLGGVLYIREPLAYEEIHLEVPSEYRNCCPCPDHWTNYVAVAYKSSRLSLVDGDGNNFQRTDKDCKVMLAGASPSREVGDAKLAFARNGEVYLEFAKTVLGVGIKGASDAYKEIEAMPGCTITVGTNITYQAQLRLVTNVGLPNGNVQLKLSDVSGKFTIWYIDSRTGDFNKLLDSESATVKNISFASWKNLLRRVADAGTAELPIFVASSQAGSAKLIFRYWNLIEGKFVQDTAECMLRSVNPPVLSDMNYDGQIGSGDIDKCIEGKVFRFWTNEETAKGDFVGQIADVAANAADLKVNGKYDLINFFPLKVDLSPLQAIWGDSVVYRIKPVNAQNGAFNFCFANVPAGNIRLMQTSELADTDGKKLSEADLTALSTEGYVFSQAEISRLSSGGEMLVVEAKAANATIEFSVEYEGSPIYSYTVPLSISSVTNMYRYLNLRWVVGDSSGESSHLSSPMNRPDEECDGRHFVFVHGYNVDPVGSRNWANQMFKRLWWAGSKSMFTAVDWKGDESHKHLPVVGEVSPNYYINVKNAFVTAPHATASINALPGEKVMLAHSLGNMLVSSAAKDYGLGYSKYYMLNAAVPMEAYDTDADASAMIDSEWRNVPLSYRASDWNTLFHVNDFRSSLSWRGRFAGIANAINCNSPTEDVLANPEEGQLTLVGGVWKIQELTKGTTLWHELNSLPFLNLNVACEGGWGINSYYSLNPLWYVYQYGFTEKAKNDLTREDAIIHPLFTPFRSESEAMHSTNLFTIADASYRDELRAKFLADAIPATSFAAGANHLAGVKDNHNMQNDMSNEWPRDKNEWLHSDIKDVSYYFCNEIFMYILQGEMKNGSQ